MSSVPAAGIGRMKVTTSAMNFVLSVNDVPWFDVPCLHIISQ